MMFVKNKQSGFTLIELMIVIAIIGILASVALPAYSTYTKKAKFSEVVLAGSSVKGLVDLCYQTKGASLTACDSTAEVGAVTADITAGTQVASVNIATTSAAITITGAATVDNRTYVLTPTAAGNTLTWAQSGTCVANGLC